MDAKMHPMVKWPEIYIVYRKYHQLFSISTEVQVKNIYIYNGDHITHYIYDPLRTKKMKIIVQCNSNKIGIFTTKNIACTKRLQ